MQVAGRAVLLTVLTVAVSAWATTLAPGVLDAPPPAPVIAEPPLPPTPPPPALSPAELSAKVDPTVVTISAEWGSVGVAGTGFVVSADGLVVTNFHVVEDATYVSAVNVGNGLIYDASVLGYDETRDLAVLRLASAVDLQVAPIGSSAGLAVGDGVTAVGNSEGGGVLVAAPGRVVALNKVVTAESSVDGSRNELTGMIQIDADVRAGDSGGPLVDAWGNVIGVDAAGLSEEARATSAPEAYAIPIDDTMAVVEQIREGRSAGTVHVGPTPYLGIGVRDVSTVSGSEPTQGAAVASVEFDSPAERSGLLRGDVIVSIDGTPVQSSDDLVEAMVARLPGDDIQLEWVSEQGLRQQQSVTLEVGTPTA